MHVPHLSRDPRLAQLARILDSEKFAGSGKMGRFLRFVVEEAVAGRGDQVKEYTVGIEVYDKPSTYDPRVDSTVRVEAGKLRTRLAAYYDEEGKSDPIVISIPKGGYVPAFETRTVVELPLPEVRPPAGPIPVPVPNRNRRPTWALFATAAAVLVIGSISILILRDQPPVTPAAASRLLTHDLGVSIHPSLSAEGKLLVYASDRAGRDNLDIWVQPVSGGDPLQITDSSANEHSPVFSPDGSRIVFRSEADGGGLYEVPALGGTPRLVAKGGHSPAFSSRDGQLAFHTGDTQLAMTGVASGALWVLPPGGEPRRIRPDFTAAINPIWTPDGTHLLFLGYPNADFSTVKMDWWVTAADGKGPAINTGFRAALIAQNLCGIWNPWSPQTFHGSDVLFSTSCGSGELWKIGLSTRTWQVAGYAQRVTVASAGASDPFSAGGRIVYSEGSRNNEIWALPIDAQGRSEGKPLRLTESSAAEDFPSISTDGKTLVFASDRGRDPDIWSKNLSTGKEQVLISAPGTDNYPEISPDGKTLTWHHVMPDSSDPTGWNHIAWRSDLSGENRQKLCEHCAYMGLAPDGRRLLDLDGNPIGIALLEPGVGYSPFLRDSQRDLLLPTPSRDRTKMAFVAKNPGGTRSIYTIPFREPAPPKEQWRLVAQGAMPAWSTNSQILYYIGPHEGTQCVMGRKIAADGEPAGDSFAVAHFHNPRLAVALSGSVFRSLSVSRDKIVLTLRHVTGQIRTLKNETR